MPPKKLESMVAFFLPAAVREHVLGDLQERYRSPSQYAFDGLRTVPMVVVGRILRTAKPRRLALEGASILLAYYAGSVFGGGEGIRVWLAAAITLTALVVRDAYTAIECRVRPVTAFEAAVTGWLIQLGFGILPAKTALLGASISAALLLMVRLSGESRAPRAVTGSLDEVPERARRFEKTVRGRNLREYAGVGMVLLMFGFAASRAKDWTQFAPPLLMCAGALLTGWLLRKYGTPLRLPPSLEGIDLLRFYRTEVERQRRLLSTVWRWYLGPLIPGFLAIFIGQMARRPDWKTAVPAFFLFLLMTSAVIWLNRREARHLKREIESLDAIERDLLVR